MELSCTLQRLILAVHNKPQPLRPEVEVESAEELSTAAAPAEAVSGAPVLVLHKLRDAA